VWAFNILKFGHWKQIVMEIIYIRYWVQCVWLPMLLYSLI